VHRAILRRLRAQPSQGVTALRGIRGFHGDHRPHGDRLFQLGRRVPVVTVVVDAVERIAEAFDVVDELTREHGLVTVEDVAELHHPGRG
jgi:PII-like signaling protein